MLRILSSRKLCSTASSHYDLVVVGNGVVGSSIFSTLACSKITSNLKCLLIGKSVKPRSIPFEYPLTKGRAYTISLGSKNYLANIDVWKTLEERGINKVTKMGIWDSYGGKLEFDGTNQKPLCFMVDELNLSDVMVKKYEEICKNSTTYSSMMDKNITQINQDYKGNKVEIVFDTGESISSHLLIGCDGAQSIVRNLLALETIKYDYNTIALTATATAPEGPCFTAYQKYSPSSTIALLPLSKGVYSIVWMPNTEFAKELMNLSDKEFLDKFNSALFENVKTLKVPSIVSQIAMAMIPGYIAGRRSSQNLILTPLTSIVEGSRGQFPLRLITASQYGLGRVVLAGDSAHRVHPMTGRGLNLGLGDAELLTDIIQEIIMSGNTLNQYPSFLTYYDRKRKAKAIPNIALCTGLKLIYSDYGQHIASLAAIGLNIVDMCNPLKNLLKDVASH